MKTIWSIFHKRTLKKMDPLECIPHINFTSGERDHLEHMPQNKMCFESLGIVTTLLWQNIR